MTHSNEGELEELLVIEYGFNPQDVIFKKLVSDLMLFITAHTNAAIARALDRLEQEVKITIYDGDDSLGKEYQAGYNSMAEATRVYQLGIMSAIEAERVKLKDAK